MSYMLSLNVTTHLNGYLYDKENNIDTIEHTNSWMLFSSNGAGSIRDMALKDVYRAHKLPPFTNLAMRIRTEDELINIQDVLQSYRRPGLIYVNGGPAGVTGLPFLVEGPFIQDVHLRAVPIYTNSLTVAQMRGQEGRKRGSTVQWNNTKPKSRSKSFTLFGGNQDLDKLIALTPEAIMQWNLNLMSSSITTHMIKALREASKPLTRLSQAPEEYYRVWPYLPRVTPDVRRILQKAGLGNLIGTEKLFLTANGFRSLGQVLLIEHECNEVCKSYVTRSMEMAVCPVAVTKDLKELGIPHNALSADRLRVALRNDAMTHCRELWGKPTLTKSLLQYCLIDISPYGDDDFQENVQRRIFSRLAGVPLLPMSDGSTRPFPRAPPQRVCFAPPTLHVLLPMLKEVFIHPSIYDDILLFKHKVFLETLHIEQFSSTVLKEYIHTLMPERYRRNHAVLWHRFDDLDSDRTTALLEGGGTSSSNGTSNGTSAISRTAAFQGANSSTNVGNDDGTDSCFGAQRIIVNDQTLGTWNLEKLIYVLWMEVLGKEAEATLGTLEWPLVPVISKGRRLLLSPAYLSILFYHESTTVNDRNRGDIQIEIERLASIQKIDIKRQLHDEAESSGGSVQRTVNLQDKEQWSWVRTAADPNLSSDNEEFVSITRATGDPESDTPSTSDILNNSNNIIGNTEIVATANAVEGRPGAVSSVATFDTEGNEIVFNRVDEANNDANVTTAAPVEGAMGDSRDATTVVGDGEIDAPLIEDPGSNIGFTNDNADGGNATTTAYTGELQAPSSHLLSALDRLGVPTLDRNLIAEVPKAIQDYLARPRLTLGKRILDCLYTLSGVQPLFVDMLYDRRRKLVVTPTGGKDGNDGNEKEAAPVDGDASALQRPNDYIYADSLPSDGQGSTLLDSDIQPLLFYDDFTAPDRASLLKEMYDGHQEVNFTSGDMERLKTLRLFTEYPSMSAVSISDYKEAYYCKDANVLNTIFQIASLNIGLGGSGKHGGPGGSASQFADIARAAQVCISLIS